VVGLVVILFILDLAEESLLVPMVVFLIFTNVSADITITGQEHPSFKTVSVSEEMVCVD